MGFSHTKNTAVQIYLTLRSLFRRDLSVRELHGPIGIAKVGYAVAKEGLGELMRFLGFLSINLAVLNFLPIPVLDGGHMVFLLWEGITRRKPSEKVMIAATYVGLAFVLSLMFFVIYLDLFVHASKHLETFRFVSCRGVPVLSGRSLRPQSVLCDRVMVGGETRRDHARLRRIFATHFPTR